MREQIKNPDFWNSLWQENLGSHMDKDPAQHWNKRAKSFNKTADSNEGSKRVQGVLTFLKKHSAFWDGMEILDIGCGPGNFSIPFAQMGAQVTAIDPAENMLEILNNNAQAKGIKNIQVMQGLWEELDIHQKGWAGKFDLVFASQSPGLRDIETLEKINACSKKYCYASGFDGQREMSLYDKFWQKYFDKPYMRNSHDVIYLINLLYALKYRPSIEFLDMSREESYSLEEATHKFKELIEENNLVLEDRDNQIKQFLSENSENGSVKQYIRQVMGLLLWEV